MTWSTFTDYTSERSQLETYIHVKFQNMTLYVGLRNGKKYQENNYRENIKIERAHNNVCLFSKSVFILTHFPWTAPNAI